jgi:riboflavin kinase/FMN adenylyltransferase
LAFTPALAALDAEQFTREVLVERFKVRQLVVGHDHRFGRGRAGDIELLRRLGARDGFEVTVVDPVREGGQAISSTQIRTAVAHGDLVAAERWLGRPYSTRGVVEQGQGRGRTLGIPTLNLAAMDPRKLLPPDGVYAVRVEWRRVRYGGMMNQGARPTFGIPERALEIHLFDFDEELYGEAVTVEWVRRLRDVRTFPSRDALVEQLARDARDAQDSLKP